MRNVSLKKVQYMDLIYIKYNMKNLSELNNLELTDLLVKGHIGNDTKNIAELRFFYNSVKEEIKRRDLNERYRRNN